MNQDFVVDFAACHTIEQLSVALGTTPDVLGRLASNTAIDLYRRHAIPKRSPHRKGEVREVFEPATEELRYFHKTLNRLLTGFASQRDPPFPPSCCFGFVRKRSILDNAHQHKGASLLLRADIGNFFPSIPTARVVAAFSSLGIDLDLSDVLGRVLSFTGALVPGLSASPLVANLVCRSLDDRLLSLSQEFGCRYTRYADDMAFSGEAVPPVAGISKTIALEGFALSLAKIRTTKRGQAHFVTGLSVSDELRPHVPKKMKRRLRQELYYCTKHSIEDHLLRERQGLHHGVNRLDGLVRYVSFVERATSYDFSSKWSALLARDDLSPTAGPNHERAQRAFFSAVDETKINIGSKTFLAVAFSYYDEPYAINKAVEDIRDTYLSDPFSGGRKSDIDKHGLHFAEANRPLQLAFIMKLPTIPMRCFVAVTEIEDTADGFRDGYVKAFQWGLRQLCERSDRGRLKLLVEQSSIRESVVRDLVEREYKVMAAVGKRRPIA